MFGLKVLRKLGKVKRRSVACVRTKSREWSEIEFQFQKGEKKKWGEVGSETLEKCGFKKVFSRRFMK